MAPKESSGILCVNAPRGGFSDLRHMLRAAFFQLLNFLGATASAATKLNLQVFLKWRYPKMDGLHWKILLNG